MNFIKITLLTVLSLYAQGGFSQKQNVFHDRVFWSEKPTLATVKQKVAQGNDPVQFNDNGFDATTNALITNNSVDVIEYLLSFKENPVDKRTHDSRIYLHWAAFSGNPNNVKLLLSRKSALDAKDSRGNTPLTFAANGGLTNPEVYDMFKAQGAELAKEKSPQGANLLLLASPFLRNEKELAYFTDNGLPLDSVDNEGNGIFNYASRRGNIDFLKMLVAMGVDYQRPNKNGGNAYFFAAQGTRGFTNSLEVYNFLNELGLKPNLITQDGNTALHSIALSKADKSIFEFFLKHHANVDQEDADRNTPFLNASARNSVEIVKLLAKNSKNVSQSNNKGQTALMLAVENNTPEVTEFLLDLGLDATAVDKSGNSVAYYLVESFSSKNPESFDKKLQMLQAKGMKMNVDQAEGNTLYHFAANKDDVALVKRLSEFKIPVNKVNAEGNTALQLAALKAKDTLVMEYLVSLGADKKAVTEFGETAYDLASENEILNQKKVELKFLK